MRTTRILILILMLGSAWGVAELYGKDLLADLGVGGGSVWLAGWALLLLSIGRGIWNKIGSSFTIGLLAASIKFVGPSTNYCHLLGIASLGLVFDLFASSLLAQGRSQWWRCALVGLFTAYGARALFVLYSIHLARIDRWVEGGSDLALEHVVRGGSVVALAALLLAPLGFWIGERAAGMLPFTAANRENAQSAATVST